jgi:hypothetical protein
MEVKTRFPQRERGLRKSRPQARTPIASFAMLIVILNLSNLFQTGKSQSELVIQATVDLKASANFTVLAYAMVTNTVSQ